MGTPTLDEMTARALALSRRAGVENTFHQYFLEHAARLRETSRRFGLFDRPLGAVLEIGPFYGYLPFLLRDRADAYRVYEGDDPAVHPLLPLYAEHRIDFELIDLFELFGPTRGAPHAFPLPDACFDTILCWETMEHFNFNPVKFARELLRLLKPGGTACITAPNRASFQNLAGLVLGRGEHKLVDAYFQFEDYESGGKKAFYGFHWREYSPGELARLFARTGFELRQHGSFTAFQARGGASAARRWARRLNRLAARLFPRHATHAYVAAQKPTPPPPTPG